MKSAMLAEVIECPFEAGRWLVIRRAAGSATVEISCPSKDAAESERRRLQREYDLGTTEPLKPGEQRQIPLGFYTDDDAA